MRLQGKLLAASMWLVLYYILRQISYNKQRHQVILIGGSSCKSEMVGYQQEIVLCSYWQLNKYVMSDEEYNVHRNRFQTFI